MMTKSPRDDLRPGFLLGQPIWLAQADTPDDAWRMAIAEAEPSADQTELESAITPVTQDDSQSDRKSGRWDRCVDRNELIRKALNEPGWERVGLVCGAGLGKTTTLQWLASAINRLEGDSPFLAFFRELEDLPEDGEGLLLEMVKAILKVTAVEESMGLEYLRRLRKEGRIVLLLDSLDQAGPDPKGPAVKVLRELLEGPWTNCRIWVSGRPYAFQVGGMALRHGHPNVRWQFVRVGQLDHAECRQLLATTDLPNLPRDSYSTPFLFDTLTPAGQRQARVPRFGRLMARLPAKRLQYLKNEATTLWELYNYVAFDRLGETGLLDDGLKADKACRLGWHKTEPPPKTLTFRKHQVRLAHDILGAMAFEMFALGAKNHPPRPLFQIDSDESAFLVKVRQRLLRAGVYRENPADPPETGNFMADWEALWAMDSHDLKFILFSADGRDGCIRWADISTAAFFAAYWACKWGGEEDFALTSGWVPDPLTKENAAYNEFWQFAMDLPEKEVQRDRWERLFSDFYQTVGISGKDPIRSTEFIHQSWERMKGTQAQLEFLGDPRRDLLLGNREWLSGFLGLAEPDSKIPGDTGTFKMGAPDGEDPEVDGRGANQDNPIHEVRLGPFRLHRFCVTNLDYEVFDPRHRSHRWRRDAHPLVNNDAPWADDRCPVVNVSWVDAWCFAKWLNGNESQRIVLGERFHQFALPSEAQWEYACRAGTSTPFHFGREHDGKTCTADVCNFDGRDPWPCSANSQPVDLNDLFRKRTMPVDSLQPNDWGFHHLHGNVWEWCIDWYSPDFCHSPNSKESNPVNLETASDPVLRGGNWLSIGRYCRSAYRIRDRPDGRDAFSGFRLAAVPVVGARSGRVQ